MAITHRTFVLLTFPLCCVSIALMATALATQHWLVATTVPETLQPPATPNQVNYGLFVGTLVVNSLATGKIYQLYMTCLADRNVCALSCLGSVEERRQQVMDLVENGISNVDCESVLSTMNHLPKNQNVTLAIDAPQVEILKTGLRKFPVDQQFINMGLWASTIAFIGLGLLMAVVGAFFAVLNTAGNPVEPLLGILGLFIWNAIAAFAISLTLVLWGVQFAITLMYNVVLDETISGDTKSDGLAALGFSYWILFGSLAVHLVNIGLLLYRRKLIRSEPPAPTIQLQEDSDGIIFLY